MRALVLALACGVCLVLAPPTAASQAREAPDARVEVSLRAASLPGPAYAWVPMPPRLSHESDPRVLDPALRARLQAALDRALHAKGYRHVDDPRQADFAVAYRVGMRDLQQATVQETGPARTAEMAMACDGDGCSQIVTQGPLGEPTIKVDAVDMVEGGLMVEVIQPSDIRVLWRAVYRGSIHARDAGTVDLDAVADRTLAQLPPAATP